MEKTADILILKRFCAIDGPFGKPSKSQTTGSGGHTALDKVENQKLIITQVFGLFKDRKFKKTRRI
jgi:hypothetical protein